MSRHRNSIATGRARRLRKRQTDAEAALWRALRSRSIEQLKFRRQHPIGGFVVDFYCEKASLAVELDGGQHADPGHVRCDVRRTEALERSGVRVLRFWNGDVLQNLEGVLQRIVEVVRKCPSPCLSPSSGGEE